MCQALFVCGQTTFVFLGGLVGYSLAADKSLATLPISITILGTAMMTIPAALFMRRVGRRLGFMSGALIGTIGVLTCAAAIYTANFALFCTGALLAGFYNAFCQYYRFAAADAADEAFKSKAISLVLAGGVIAGFVGPAVATQTRDLLAPVTYLASFIAVAGMSVVAMLLVSFVQIPMLSREERRDTGRPLPQIMAQPVFVITVLSGMIGYGVMSLVMTATPLAMIACNFADADAGFVIQWHVLGMFAPSFFTGHLIARFGLIQVMLCGAAMLAACVGLTLSGIDFVNFWLGLILLGLGWNFLFIGATTLLTTVYTPAERAKTQAANDFLVFGATATASFLSGKLLHTYGWETVNYTAVPFIILVTIAVVWLAVRRRSQSHLA